MNSSILLPFEAALKSARFIKKSGSWYLENDETILVVNLQKSNYGDQYYVNLAVWVKALGDATYPKENKCHICLRIDSLVDEKAVKCFDGEKSLSQEKRAALITGLMESKAIPFLMECASLKGIGMQMASGGFEDALVNFRVEELIRNARGS